MKIVLLLLVSCLMILISNSISSITKLNYNEAKEEVNKLANLVYQRFEYHNFNRYQFILASSAMPDYTWDILKYKFAKKIVDSINNKYSNSSAFFMIFGGSSVTAGHDNYFNQSYPLVFERRMKPIFDALGVKLIVHNIAMGANNCRPYNMCHEAQGGLPGMLADFVGWEQSYNCGKAADIFESLARWAYWNKAVVYYVASGAFSPGECAMSNDTIPWISEQWTPEKVGITDKYSLNPETVEKFKKLLHDWHEAGNPVSRFVGPLRGLYKGVGPHGFSVWGSNKLCKNDFKGTEGCNALDVRGPCYNEGGLHWLTKEASIYGHADGHGKGWHPPAGMHLLRAETLAYNYVNVLADAIYTVEKDSETTSIEDMSKKYQAKLNELQIPIPSAEECHTQCHCRNECETKPICYTNFRPHFNPNFRLDDIIVGNHTGWYAVLKECVGRDYDVYGFIDDRPYYEAKGDGSEMFVKIYVGSRSEIQVCGYKDQSFKHVDFFLDVNITNHSNYIPLNRTAITSRKYFTSECTILSNLPKGDHILTLKTQEGRPHHISSFSHVIMFE